MSGVHLAGSKEKDCEGSIETPGSGTEGTHLQFHYNTGSY